MENSILKSTKKVLGLDESYTAFDLDITTHINSTLSILNQIGVGPAVAFVVEDAEAKWEDLSLPPDQLSMVRSYVYLKVRMLFDPPTTSFLIDAVKSQIEEHEQRLSYLRESQLVLPIVIVEEVEA